MDEKEEQRRNGRGGGAKVKRGRLEGGEVMGGEGDLQDTKETRVEEEEEEEENRREWRRKRSAISFRDSKGESARLEESNGREGESDTIIEREERVGGVQTGSSCIQLHHPGFNLISAPEALTH